MKKNTIILALSVLFFSSCEKLQFDDPTSYTLEQALELVPDYYFKLATGNMANAMAYINDADNYGTAMQCLADGTTTTNRVNEWWDFTKEPRVPLNNSLSYGGEMTFRLPHNRFYLINLNANIILGDLEQGIIAIDEDSVDISDEVRSVAHFLKGMSQGYIGAIYDRGIIADRNLGKDGEFSYPNSYKEMLENAANHFDSALAAISVVPTFDLKKYRINLDLDKDGYIRFINSMAARLLACVPRDKEEAASLGNAFWTRVLNYANNGFTTDFIVPYVSGGYYNILAHRHLAEAGGGPYIPADIKVAYLADNTGTYPDAYPLDESVILPPVVSDDPRFEQYFRYTTNFGYLRSDRGRHHFTNYKHNRWSVPGSNPNTLGVTGYPNPVFLAEEVRLLRAEAKFWLGDMAGAAAELNDPTADRIALGGLPAIGATEAEVRHTLFYEYSISIDVAGTIINPWAFMRRHNLLQKGTPTEFPCPESQLQFTTEEVYTFGGFSNAGAKGKWGETTAATGEGAWRE